MRNNKQKHRQQQQQHQVKTSLAKKKKKNHTRCNNKSVVRMKTKNPHTHTQKSADRRKDSVKSRETALLSTSQKPRHILTQIISDNFNTTQHSLAVEGKKTINVMCAVKKKIL